MKVQMKRVFEVSWHGIVILIDIYYIYRYLQLQTHLSFIN